MHRVDGTGQAVVGNLRQAMRLGLGQRGVGGHHGQGGVGAGQQGVGLLAGDDGIADIEQRCAIGRARSGEHLAGSRIDHVAQRVAGYQRANRHTIERERRTAKATFHRTLDAEQFAHQSTRTRADIALRRVAAAGCHAGGITGLRVRPDAGVA